LKQDTLNVKTKQTLHVLIILRKERYELKHSLRKFQTRNN